MPLGSRFLEERDQVRSVLGLLEPSEHLYTPPPSKLSTTAGCRLPSSNQRKRSTGGEWQKQTQGQTKQPQLRGASMQPACWRLQRWSLAGGRVRTILVPGMYAFGLSRYMYRCSSHHVMPVAKRR